MQAVSTMSTRQAMAARKNSKDVSVRPKAINARSRPMRGAMTFQPNITRNIALSADGRRAVQVLTTPPLNISENTAMSQVWDVAAARRRQYPVAAVEHRYGHYSFARLALAVEPW